MDAVLQARTVCPTKLPGVVEVEVEVEEEAVVPEEVVSVEVASGQAGV
jgi:hypothetical protein